MRKILILILLFVATCACAEIQVINGVKYECKDGLCMMVEECADEEPAPSVAVRPRLLEGACSADEFIAFLKGEERVRTAWLGLFVILLGGLALNLTPCVLPMVPINLMIIGKSAVRGAWYGLGIALAYGALGVAAVLGGLAFGTIQGSPWFNLIVALVFLALSLAMADVFFIDLSKRRTAFAQKKATMLPGLFAFLMGALSAVLAGACVAPILISVLVLTAKLYAEGKVLALALPFVLGLGMALPWPFLGAGLQVLPKPGAWMKIVNRLFALIVLGFAAWYGYLAFEGFRRTPNDPTFEHSNIRTFEHFSTSQPLNAQPSTLNALISTLNSKKPILVDCWATWCKNCAAMDRVLEEPKVREALRDFTVIRLQAEDMKELIALPGFESIKGLPAFVILPYAP